MPIDLPEGVYSGFSIYGSDVFIDSVTSLGEHWSSPKLKPSSKNSRIIHFSYNSKVNVPSK